MDHRQPRFCDSKPVYYPMAPRTVKLSIVKILVFQIRYCKELGIAAEKGAKLFIVLGSCSCVARLLAGFACNHPRVDTFRVYQVGQFAAGLSAILMTVAPTFKTLSACVALYGLGDGLFYTSFSCLVFSVSPQKSAAVLGWQMMTEALFMASGPTLAGEC